jgi:cohesin complex subunit SA-1/2
VSVVCLANYVQALILYLNLHILLNGKIPGASPVAKACSLTLEDETQHRLGGAFSATLERHASDLDDLDANKEGDDDLQLPFLQLVSVFVGAIRCGVIEVDHAKEPLAGYGRFGGTYDAIMRRLVDVLRDEGIYNKQGQTVIAVAEAAIQDVSCSMLEMIPADVTSSLSIYSLMARRRNQWRRYHLPNYLHHHSSFRVLISRY